MGEGRKTRHVLSGLEPDNLLAFLALLGLLRALDRVRPDWQARVAWAAAGAPLRPVLHLRQASGREALAEAAVAGLLDLASELSFGGRKDPSYSQAEARQALRAHRGHPVFDALMSDGACREDGRVWPTPLCFLFGQGHQHFLERLATVPLRDAPPREDGTELTATETILETLFTSWTRPDRTEGLRWDVAEDRRYALRAANPSGDPAGMQHGATRLAAIGWPVLDGTAVQRGAEARFLVRGSRYASGHRESGQILFTWPLWSRPARLSGIAALLAHPACSGSTRGSFPLPADIIMLLQARRISVGKFFNVTRAIPLHPARQTD